MADTIVRSILIIDDDSDDFDLVQEAIKEIDPAITVHFLQNVEEAEKYKGSKFDLVLLDINMPRHDGFYWLREIRQNCGKSFPVIMYTNSQSPQHISRAYEEGASLFFSKPESFTNLISGLYELICLDWSEPIEKVQEHLKVKNCSSFQYA